jgi:hypothetical protein
MDEIKKPKYEFVNEEGESEVQPSKRKINKTMEVTESFTMYDVLAYTMKMEKAIEDKETELEGLKSMLEAYQKEIAFIEKELGVTKMDEKFHKELHEKLAKEEAEKVDSVVEVKENVIEEDEKK